MPTHVVLTALGASWTASGLLLAACLWLIPLMTRKPIRRASHNAILKLSSLMMLAGPAFCLTTMQLAPEQPAQPQYVQDESDMTTQVAAGESASRR